jgi:hemoglobin-like flavoprotein
MNPHQIQLVQSSFARLAPVQEEFATRFYARLFELDPGLRAMFGADLAEQRAKLMAALRVVVGGLAKPEAIKPALWELGRRHARYGVQVEHYVTVGEVLLWSLEQALGAALTLEAKRAWAAAYGLVAWTMIAAAEAELAEPAAAAA